VESVLAQTESNWELIIVDDGSTDGSARVVDNYHDSRIKLVREKNSGVSVARNVGARLAKSEFVCFIDADDFWTSNHLADLREAMERYPACVFWSTAYWLIRDDAPPRIVRFPVKEQNRVCVVDDYFQWANEFEQPVHSSAVMIRKSVLFSVGGFPADIDSGEDLVTWAKLGCAGPLGFVGRPSAFYVAAPISRQKRSSVLRRPQCPDPVAVLLKQLLTTYRQPWSLKRYISNWHRIRAMSFLELNERRSAIRELTLAIRGNNLCRRDLISLMLLILPGNLRNKILEVVRLKIHWATQPAGYTN
jgi:glycosyltransferase involved in cell wall biosynthesis